MGQKNGRHDEESENRELSCGFNDAKLHGQPMAGPTANEGQLDAACQLIL